ncbi:hypothetical protein G7074_25350 [Pedobacter sp. HDW13]|uniref:hypothetical protein n=1 Tax=Pedobacter sp. HDW13 TaxID=2714940 RepID=UPI00140A75E3|nr:hypothetical protein [Pedobacter sp. HDW13]QIL42292.1 hypothetical protein G7074_25350 [Pedobacter sp. HDW13]
MENYPNLASAGDLPDRDLEIVIFNGTTAIADTVVQQAVSDDVEDLDYLLRCRNNFRNAIGIGRGIYQAKLA